MTIFILIIYVIVRHTWYHACSVLEPTCRYVCQ